VQLLAAIGAGLPDAGLRKGGGQLSAASPDDSRQWQTRSACLLRMTCCAAGDGLAPAAVSSAGAALVPH